MPSDAQLAEYAKRLPPIYRDILGAFPAIEPTRKSGYGLAFPTLAVHFADTGDNWRVAEIQIACERLRKNEFLEIKNQIFAHPTDLGERLISAVTGKSKAEIPSVPELPAPTWLLGQ